MLKHLYIMAAASAISLAAAAESVPLSAIEYYGPVAFPTPVSLGAKSPVENSDLADRDLNLAAMKPNQAPELSVSATDLPSLHAYAFNLENRSFAQAKISVENLKNFRLFVDGKQQKADEDIKLNPGTHRVVIRFSTDADTPTESLKINVTSPTEGAFTFPSEGKRMFTLNDVMCGARVSKAAVSPSGRFVLETLTDTREDGSSTVDLLLYDLKAKSAPARVADTDASWMPASDKLYAVRNSHELGRHVVIIDPATNAESVFAAHLPEGDLQMAPTEDFLLFTLTREGQKEDPNVYQILEPDDRQPGWRDRQYAAIYRDGALIPLTSGVRQSQLLDVSADGTKALILTSHTRLQQRPTSLMSILSIDLGTFEADTIVANDGFIASAVFSPTAKQILVTGSPEAFGRIGCTLPADVTPSMAEYGLFLVDVDSKNVTPLTKGFNPSVQKAAWSKADGKVYFYAENRDMMSLYQLDPASDKIAQVEIPDNVVKGFSLSAKAPELAVWAQSDSNPDRLYAVNTKSGKHTLLHEPSASRLADVKLGTCQDWNFVNEKGDTVYGRFYLPDNFDPNKKYPLIVNYYGGCAPTTRTFESRYPHHVYSSLGYVVYVVQPSGATGFGQEWASRHVSTAGQGVAEDIIQGTKKFAEEHPYVDASKIGCIGASYGGFMTMYLQTVTDLFAAAISHAGISDHTSYWGEGWWGYNYSEVCMGADKPWDKPDLFVKQSPLYNAHKVKTPLLFLHGDGDTNVPPGESIQMFTALKLLGCPTALVEVKDQNHHIIDFEKRRKWQDTIFAWFAKYLKDDPAWWDALYPAKDY